jgi:hypothetical protein
MIILFSSQSVLGLGFSRISFRDSFTNFVGFIRASFGFQGIFKVREVFFISLGNFSLGFRRVGGLGLVFPLFDFSVGFG